MADQRKIKVQGLLVEMAGKIAEAYGTDCRVNVMGVLVRIQEGDEVRYPVFLRSNKFSKESIVESLSQCLAKAKTI